MPNRTIQLLILFSALCWLLASCRRELDVPATPVISFSNHVQPILTSNCSQDGCHGNKNQRRFSLVTYDDVISSGIVTTGDAHNSKMIEAATGRSGLMPPSPERPLTDNQIRYLYNWIAQGAKNN